MTDTFVRSICALLAVCAICFAGAYSCTKTNEQYNELAAKCMEAGGNWVPQSGSVNAAYCLQGGRAPTSAR